MLDAGTKFSFLTISQLIRSDPAWLDHDPGARERSTQVDVHPLRFRQRGICESQKCRGNVYVSDDAAVIFRHTA